MNMATIAEELINAPIPPASNIMRTISRASLRPPRFQYDFTQTVRDPSIHQGLADDEDGRNEDYDWIAKAGQRLLRREYAGQHQR